jgi:asparagine synthase (glutamine-hydrolysing)
MIGSPGERNRMAGFVGSVRLEAGQPQFHSSPAPLRYDGCLVLFRGFISNREDLAGRLLTGAAVADTPDARLVARAYRRWGPALQQHLIGEYCAALFDEGTGELLLTNDALGCLPLFHSERASDFSFASHIDRLAEAIGDTAVDDRYIADYLLFGLHFGKRTAFAAIRRLGGGRSVRWANGRWSELQTWSLAEVPPLSRLSDGDADEQFRQLLQDAVTTATRGTTWSELSGGLDSSSIACVAARAGIRDLGLISIVYSSSRTADERRWMTEVLRSCKAPWHALDGDEVHPFARFPDRKLPEPGRNAMVWGMLEQYERLARENAVDVILSGFGGDAVLYASPRPVHLGDRLRGLQLARLWRELRQWQTAAAQRRSLMHLLGRDIIEPTACYYSRRMIGFEASDAFAIPWLAKPWLTRLGIDHSYRPAAPSPRLASVGEQQYSEGLWQVFAFAGQRWTQLTTAFELRHPLLYRPLVEFMHALPWEQKLRPGQDRLLQRRALAGILPEAIRTRSGKASADQAYFEGLRKSRAWISLLTDRPRIVERGYVDGVLWNDAVKLAQLGYVHQHGSASFVSAAALEFWLRQLESGAHDRIGMPAP